MIVVLDASAAVDAVLNAGSPFRSQLREADAVIAPDLIVAEICSAFRKYVRARIIPQDQAERSVNTALALVSTRQPMAEIVADVLALSSRLDTSVYDLFYLALALRAGAVLLTADQALRQTAIKAGVASPGS